MSKRAAKPAAELEHPMLCPSSGHCPLLAPRSCPHRGKHEKRGSCGNPCSSPGDWKATAPWCGPCQPFKAPVLVPPVLGGTAEAGA